MERECCKEYQVTERFHDKRCDKHINFVKFCKKPTDHYWLIEHTVYSGLEGKDSPQTAVVHRQCNKCGVHQLAKTKAWHKPHKDYELTDLR